jgi:2-iminobutanoate/2-iminopropanoate deaminase
MQFTQTDRAPIPAGHYSQAVVHHGLVFVAGQLPIVPGQSEHRPGSIAEQTEQTLRNVQAVLEASGSRLDLVLQATLYVSEMALWSEVNAVYARVMGSHRPARAIVPVKELHHGYQIEIQVIAAQAGATA